MEELRRRLKSGIKIDPVTGCWNWQRSRDSSGYGKMSFKCKSVRCSRLAFMAFKGPIPEKMMVCHTCDNRLCCNPDHLFTGTNTDNQRDMRAKGRASALQVLPAWTKLTPEIVLRIRATNTPTSQLAKEYGVSFTQIWLIRKRRCWKWV